MAATRSVTRVADCDDVIANGNKIPDALLPDSSSGPFVLRNPGASYLAGGGNGFPLSGIDFGLYWLQDPTNPINLANRFVYEGWFRPRKTLDGLVFGGIIWDDTNGGGHVLLVECNGGTISGNIWNGTSAIDYTGNYAAAENECFHMAYVWDGSSLQNWINGICDGVTPFAGPRVLRPQNVGLYRLSMGGVDHQNFVGDFLWGVAYESALNRESYTPSSGFPPYVPDRYPFNLSGNVSGNTVVADFACDFTRRGDLSDISAGYLAPGATVRVRHTGNPTQRWNAIQGMPISGSSTADAGLPDWVTDSTSPWYQPLGSTPAPTDLFTGYVPTIPPGAIVYDSLKRQNQTFAYQASPSLGQTDGGSAGRLTYSVTPSGSYYGILGGCAANLGHLASGNIYQTATVDPHVTDIDLRASTANGGRNFGLCWRFADHGNHWYLNGDSAAATLRLQNWQGGTANDVLGLSPSGPFTTLRVVDKANVISVYADNVLLGTVTSSLFAGNTRLGFCTGSNNPAVYSINRVRDFTVYAAP